LTGAQETTTQLSSAIFLTGNLVQPCPRCSATGDPAIPGGLAGSPSSPQTGFCNRGPNQGGACTTTNSVGLSRDCRTDAVDGTPAGVLSLDLSPLTTSTVTRTSATGFFCTGQAANAVGCFSTVAGGQTSANCRTITENGSPAGPLTRGVPADTVLASVFCIPATADGTVNATARLPGPGATALIGFAEVFN
jgi:hypothetical protein